MPTSKKILLIEDDQDILESLSVFLEYEGYQVKSVTNGKDGLEELAQGLDPDVVLLDLMMPIMNGYEFMDEMKKRRLVSQKPPKIIIMSAASDIEKISKLHTVSFIKKPLSLDTLIQQLEN